MAARRRLDAELVRRRLAPDDAAARQLIAGRRVRVAGAVALGPSRLVSPAEPVTVDPQAERFVGRGGHKLDAALTSFGLDVTGRRALDVGSSTGGFTDCLLQRGAAHVVAVDVGTHQLHERLRGDPRVTVLERTDIRDAPPLQPAPSVAAVDVSFISVTAVLGPVLSAVAGDADVVVLVKPQFEAARADVSRSRGVIEDPALWRAALDRASAAAYAAGAAMIEAMPSPLRGASGNVEFLVHLRPGALESPGPDLDAVVRAVA